MVWLFSLNLNQRLMLQCDKYELARYFSEYLTQISLIINNIKHNVYDLVEVSMTPQNKATIVFDNISSIILSTNKTYEDLKKIEAVLNGIVKSRRDSLSEGLHTPTNHLFRSRSQNNHPIFYSPRQKLKIFDTYKQTLFEEKQQSFSPKTIKRQFTNIKSEIKEEVQRSQSSEDETLKGHQVKTQINKMHSLQYDNKKGWQADQNQQNKLIFKSITPRQKTISAPSELKLEERINIFLKNNRVSLNTIISNNSECLKMVRSVKKQLKQRN